MTDKQNINWNSMPAFLSIREVAAIIDRTPATVHKLIKTAGLPATLIIKRYKVPKREFRAWLDKHPVRPHKKKKGTIQ